MINGLDIYYSKNIGRGCKKVGSGLKILQYLLIIYNE